MDLKNQFSPCDTTIGWIGTGVMGVPMAGHLIKEGYKCYVFNRTKEKAGELLNRHAEWIEAPAELAAKSDLIFTIVGFPEDVEDIYFGKHGLLINEPSGKIC